MGQARAALSELQELGLTVDIDETVAVRIMGQLLIIDGISRQKPLPSRELYYGGHMDNERLYAAYSAVAKEVVDAATPDAVIREMIPTMIYRFRLRRGWLPTMELDTLVRVLEGPISEWNGKRLLMSGGAATSSPESPDEREMIAHQLDRLRDESGLTVEELAERIGVEARSVFRHLSGKVKPYRRNISAYERVFSKLLKRQVTIRKMS